MASFGERVTMAVCGSVIFSPTVAALGAMNGYIYAKLADLPPGQAAQAYAVWAVAGFSIGALAASITENETGKLLINIFLPIITDAIAISELRKRGLMGEKLLIAIILIRTLTSSIFTYQLVKTLNG